MSPSSQSRENELALVLINKSRPKLNNSANIPAAKPHIPIEN